ncbi:GGDEF domain-containing protein [Shewanella frigidimarina]|uniref:diguanylate cyclase n=1 Tax=Shewanella frigidimarina (strain NCIMB 400) TaxID=318167 RepID=Q082P2_SHEFN|nr:GGDEF domain-containing protein [Shewanella frigidimarina]ABI71773.1 diguanylate cyclase [Shewanella frigidimarina NCIMB 400]MBB1382199.1 GGDEF domain-containing protein [Shewanella sp. SR41-2]RPA61348.1 GGDEF domain-containing protein [Shewanella frigidimarina]HBF48454.1 GGDEF domain-containing protein [Shewanella frigidimarina]|tara:strand:+ start:1210 stop:2232 length:1023 start_codon:yes stop_codon:yes gene_type:complete
MHNTQNLEQTSHILHLALPKMATLSIPVTPENYAIWFDYFAERNLNLKRAIDGLIANGVQFTPEVNLGLYNRFIEEQSPEVIENVQIETQILINSLLNKIEQLNVGTESFSTNLNEFGEKLQTNPNTDELNLIVGSIIAEVDQVIANNHQMSASLESLSDEIANLKDEMENLSKVAMTDELTSLKNRRSYELFAAEQMTKFVDTQTVCSLLMIDIDNFKMFNDTFGHLIGDKVLAYVALAMKHTVKGDDLVARYGGEEFVVMLPNAKLIDAVNVAEKIRERIALKQLSIGKEKKQNLGHITVSIGVATIQTGDDVDTLLSRADEQLYIAKAAGKNCVKFG